MDELAIGPRDVGLGRAPAGAATVRGGRAVWPVLFLRMTLAVAFQAAVAAAFVVGGAADPWRAAADWWLAWFGLVSVVNLLVLRSLLHAEGRRLRDLYQFSREGRATDLKWVAIWLVASVPLTVLPNLLLSQALWGTADVSGELTIRPLPVAAAMILVVTFPIVHALAELPTYFGYVMPRLEAATGWGWRAMLVSALVLSAQHMALPLIFDWRYLAWRGLMFLPFAIWIGYVIRRRPTTLPYLVVGHALLDSSLPILVLLASL
jgi:hypothetical protein